MKNEAYVLTLETFKKNIENIIDESKRLINSGGVNLEGFNEQMALTVLMVAVENKFGHRVSKKDQKNLRCF